MDPFERHPKKRKFLEIIGKVFFNRIYSNLFIFILIIIMAVAATSYLKETTVTVEFPPETDISVFQKSAIEDLLSEKCSTIGAEEALLSISCSSLETECPECECPEPEQTECMLDCDICPKETVTEQIYLYRCANGLIVNSSSECEDSGIEITSKYVSTVNGISIALDEVGFYYYEGNDSGKIYEVNYTIVNEGQKAVLPKVGLKIYEKWTYEMANSPPMRNFKFEDVLGIGQGLTRSEKINVILDEYDKKIRLDLIDSLPDPDETIVGVYRDIVEDE